MSFLIQCKLLLYCFVFFDTALFAYQLFCFLNGGAKLVVLTYHLPMFRKINICTAKGVIGKGVGKNTAYDKTTIIRPFSCQQPFVDYVNSGQA